MNFQVRVIPELQNMIVTAIVLLILYLIFRKFLYKPVSVFLQKRKDLIQEQINEAKDLKEEALLVKKNQKSIIDGAHLEGQKIIEEAKKIGDGIKENIILEAKKEAKEIIEKSKRDAEKQKIKALEEMKNQSVEMAVLIASKILEEQLNINKQNMLIDKFINEVGVSQ